MLKKILIGAFLFGIVSLLFINARTPFFTNSSGAWSVGYGFSQGVMDPIQIDSSNIYEISHVEPFVPGSQLVADPFFLHEKDTFYLFFEHLTTKSRDAAIGVLTSVDGKNYNYRGTVLDEPFHLSYPQVFKHNGTYYMLPETKTADNILLYSTENFPFDWTVNDTLVKNVRLKDPSIYLSDSLNLMVASDDEMVMTLFRSNGLHDEWRPVKELMRGTEARPGGRIFAHGSRLFLPVQNSARGYGNFLALYEFVLDGNDISLRKVKDKILGPQPGIPQFSSGMHHFDIQPVGDKFYQVYDGTPILEGKKTFNWVKPLKYSYLDLMNLIK